MKYIKNFESLRDEYGDIFAPRDSEDEPQTVPGFELGTIDPDDHEVYDYGEDSGEIRISEAESYKTFIKVVKERNFTENENENEIKINLTHLGNDYCMSIYNPMKHLNKLLNDELKGKYISDGFDDMMKDTNITGIIEEVFITYYDNMNCYTHFSLKLKGIKKSNDYYCKSIITIDELKTSTNKYNL